MRGNRRVKGIIMMIVMMVMGCNSGVLEAEQGKNKFLQSLVNVSNEFLNVFTSFGEMVGSVLGLNVESKKSDVGKYFKTVQSTVEGIKSGLNKIVAEMKEEKNPNAEGVESAVKTLVEGKLDKIIEGAKTAGEAIGDAGDPIANVADQDAGAVGTEVDNIIKGIKGIVEVVLKEGNAEAGDAKKATDLGNRDATAAGMLFANNNAGAADAAKKSAADAAKAVGAVTGADILQAIVRSVDADTLAKHNSGDGNAANGKKDAVVAGGIVLRAISKNGKFAGPSGGADNDYAIAAKGAAVSAVTKALDTLTIAIRKTIDLRLKEVKKVMKISSDTPLASEKSGSVGQN
ncbi:variable large family protein [Borrelia crocidurae]|uniref:Variable large protein n=1 Tax=Borrelia crocidurae (strain Achema) TaxID=1155096 RepID=I0FEP5_BORCA|nr:variable large family protein [Borrelia crocidurae]AFI31951.1 Vlp protein, gamma subfamily [Borrelia crocidurae str. Achema]